MSYKRFPAWWVEKLMRRISLLVVVRGRGIKVSCRVERHEYIYARYIKPNSSICPFHVEITPSFVVHEERIYYCFGCGAGGDAISFLMKNENWSFRKSVACLAKSINFPFPKTEKKRRKRHGRNKNWNYGK